MDIIHKDCEKITSRVTVITEMKFTINPADKPLRDIVLSKDDLLNHAFEIARFHAHAGLEKKRRYLFPRVAENMEFLQLAYSEVSDYVKRTGDMIPAAEWFLDNFYLLKDLRQEIESNLPSRYERQLPRLAGGLFQGYPRVFALMVELIEHTDSHLQAETLRDFINTYQAEVPLSSGELWAIPIMLRIALLENIRRMVEQVVFTQHEREGADRWIVPFAHVEHKPEEWTELLDAAGRRDSYSPAYAERLLRRLRDLGPEGAPVLHWFDRVLAKQDATAEGMAKLEHQRQAMAQVSMGHAITSLRFLSEEDWPRFFEEISLVEKVLLSDPDGTYPRMDFDSRDKYRHRVEKLARRFGVSELVVARKVLEWSEQASKNGNQPASHVGYYLLGPGCQQLEEDLEKEWGPLRHFWSRLRRGVRSNPGTTYFGGIFLLTALILYFFGAYAAKYSGLGMVLLALAVMCIPASSIAIALVHWGVTRILPPSFFPKLELQEKIPEELRTLVVIPTFLNSVPRVRELLGQMEVYFLANQDPNLHFALLGDYPDADSEVAPGDPEVLAAAVSGIEALNQKYGSGRFYLFNRKRQWNEAEGLWMGWERKRGKLIEFNRLLLGKSPTSYETQIGELSLLQGVRYVITLDADTQLPRGAAKKLIGTMAHPLHAPRLSEDGKRVTGGYGILQPRVGVSILNAGASFFSRIFSGKVGIDPYTTAVSDVYQDLFGEGSFTGKGIYDLAVFHQVTEDFPENTILSHDLLEGLYARTGLVTDIELIDGFPAKYHSFVRRLHRWVRGDWQILPWLFKPLPLISRWKIFDNLRRSLEAATQALLILLGFVLFPGQPWVWAGLVLLNLLIPVMLGVINHFLDRSGKNGPLDLLESLTQVFLLLAFLPFQAYVQLDAIARSLYRQFVSHRGMLEWETAADTERRVDTRHRTSWQLMFPAVAAVLLYFAVLLWLTPGAAVMFSPLALIWLAAPWLAYKVSLPLAQGTGTLSPGEQAELNRWARRIWAFFEDFVADDDNWLPPDNVQADPPNGVAHRTSPTNMGLALLTNLAARDQGYLTLTEALRRTAKSLNTLEKLERWKGHFYNWYDTKTLQPLQPLYVSSVDSGNFVVYVLTLLAGLQEMVKGPVLNMSMLRGLRQTYELLLEDLDQAYPEFESFRRSLDKLLQEEELDIRQFHTLLQEFSLPSGLPEKSEFWAQHLMGMIESFKSELTALYPWLGQVSGTEADTLAGLTAGLDLRRLAESYVRLQESGAGAEWSAGAQEQAQDLLRQSEELQKRLRTMVDATDFKPLYNEQRQLFSIGYRINDQALDKSYYDLLASEARQASYLAIARGEVPQSHWFRLGRTLTRVKGRRSLASWSGTMFEFLMPLLVMRTFPGTLLDETYRSVVEVQRLYAAQRSIPWGISESGFYMFDAQRNYQYKAFGVPGLGLKRGLVQELVIAPYATFLALMVDPRAALANLKTMREKGFAGAYGLFEAIDYTSERVPVGPGLGIVQSFMAHHQGMSLLALDNVLHGNIMQRRFHADAIIQSSELLLQERAPAETHIASQPEEHRIEAGGWDMPDMEGPAYISLNTADSVIPVTHFLANGQYSVMLSNAGSGYSRWGNISVSRWREDVTRDSWGMYFYIQNLNSGSVWSSGFLPCGVQGDGYKVTFAPDRVEYYRKDGNIVTRTEICVSPEDQVEVRRLSLTNHSQHDRTLEITSYFETVLARPSEDLAHPAFGNLFIQTEFTHRALLASRRPRRENQARLWLMHTVALEGEGVGSIQYETDRSRFIGRGKTLARPQAMEPNQPLSNTTGAVLDPIMSLRQRVRIRPGQTVRVSFGTGIGENREEVIRLAEKYQDHGSAERAFQLAWTYSQMELRHLNFPPLQANEALNLAGNLLYLSPCRQELGTELARNTRGQSSLWPYAISGDLPVVLLRVQEQAHLDMVRQFLVVHEYWRLKGLQVDLVILNEDQSGYIQDLQDALRDLISTGHARELLNRAGGIFLLQKDLLPPEDLTLLLTVARAVFSGQGGSCTIQIRKQSKLLKQKTETAAYPGPGVVWEKDRHVEHRLKGPACPELPASLQYPNGYGGFSPDGREYIMALGERCKTPLPWINVIANPGFGFQVSESGAGYTWSQNSRENKLTPWSNDPVTDPHGEVLYLRDEESGDFWTPTPGPVPGGEKYLVRHGQGYTVFEHSSNGLEQRLLMFVPPADPVKIVQLSLRNHSEQEIRLTAFYYAELVLGVTRELTLPYLVTGLSPEQGAILARNVYQEEFAGRYAFLCGCGGTTLSYTGDRTEFIGRNGSLTNPAALRRETLSGSVGAGLDPCAVLQLAVNLKPGEEKTLWFVLGEAAGREDLSRLAAKYSEPDQVHSALSQVHEMWDQVLGVVQVQTPDRSMDLLLNRWLLYQTVVCRIWARSAFYQSGGAFGFRDQLQDSMALVIAAPQWTRQQILHHASHQFVEGDVQHWWHQEKNKGIRTKFSDDLLWLPYVTADYVEHTGDYSILDEQAGFLAGEFLGENEDERYFVPGISGETGSVYEHCLRAIDRGLRFGSHGLPLIGSGDWNDGFSRIGIKGKGESVWLGWFLYVTLQRFARLCQARGDEERSKSYLATAEELKENLERQGWDGGWYRRAYFDDGTPLGSARNDECQIDCIAQSWAVISGAAKPSRARDAMLALEHYLLRRDEGILLLLAPPFDHSKLDPGYIKGYVPGVRENGGQYTHGAIWAVLAWAEMGEGNRAAEVFQMLNPINHTRTEAEVARYKAEPYVMAADVYAIPPHGGRGGWSWYTGAAGWMYQAGLEGILGFRLQADKLSIRPCIPKHWPGYRLEYRYKNTLYNIEVENPAGKNTGVEKLMVDGQETAGDTIVLSDDGRQHQVKVIM